MWSELFRSRLAEAQATRTPVQAEVSKTIKQAYQLHEEGLKTGEYALKKHKQATAQAEYFARQGKKKKEVLEAKPKIQVNTEELLNNIDEHENHKPWSRLRVMIKKAKIREYFKEQGWEEPAEEWLFELTNKRLPDIIITYDTEQAKITSIKGMNRE